MQQQCQHCSSLLKQMVGYRQQSLTEKEAMKKEIERYRLQLEKFTARVEKRIEARVREERSVFGHRFQELEQVQEEEVGKLRAVLGQKDRVIDQMRQLVRMLESEKRELIQNNTKVLVELSQGIEGDQQQQSQATDHNYKELMRMYQFLIDENNQLKKDIYLVQRQNLNQSQHSLQYPAKNDSFAAKQDKSLNSSQYKPKSILDCSKAEPTHPPKAQPSKDKTKDKRKMPPTKPKK